MHFASACNKWLLVVLCLFLSLSLHSTPTYPSSYTTHTSLTCLGCSVSNPANAINANTSDFATIAIPLGILSSSSLELEFASVMPAGSQFSLLVEDPLNLVVTDVDYTLLHHTTSTTHTGWTVEEEENASSKKILSTFTTSPSNKVRISVSGLLTAIKRIRVYSAYFTPVALPVSFTHFKANSTSSEVTLHWLTSREAQQDSFHVLRSTDLQRWQTLATLDGQHPSPSSTYTFTDITPLEGINYYQIKQISQQGTIAFSSLNSVHFASSGRKRLLVYPNPALPHEPLHITIEGRKDAPMLRVRMYSLQGVCVWSTTMRVSANHVLLEEVTSLPPGRYQLVIESQQDQTFTQLTIL